MGFLDIFKREPVRVSDDTQSKALRQQQYQQLQQYFDIQTANVAYKEFAIQLAVSRLANAVVKSKFYTYSKGESVRGDVWYKLNYEPNNNQNASVFWNKVIDQMVNNPDGALVIQLKDGQLLCADSFVIDAHAARPNVYHSIVVDTMVFDAVWDEEYVWHLTLNNSKVRQLIDSLYVDYGKLLGSAIKNYNRNNALKMVLNIGTTFDSLKQKYVVDENNNPVLDSNGRQLTEYDTTLDDLFENRFKAIFGEKDSVLPLEDGLELNNVAEKTNGAAASAIQTTRDIAALFNDVVNMVADAFSIPRGLLKGDTADAGQMTDNFIAFAVNPLIEQIESEINRKMYGQKAVAARSYLRIRTDGIRNYDITKLATSAELMSRIGAMSVNEVLDLLDREPIAEDWADKHLMSKNYALIEDALKGGDEDGQDQEDSSEGSSSSDQSGS